MIRVLAVRLLDWIARQLRTAADSVEHRGTMIYRVHSRREIAKAQANEERAAVERLIQESTPATDRLCRLHRVGTPIHRDR